jgi:hypothetical protein
MYFIRTASHYQALGPFGSAQGPVRVIQAEYRLLKKSRGGRTNRSLSGAETTGRGLRLKMNSRNAQVP